MESFKICTIDVEDPEVLAEFLALISVTFKNRDEYKEVKAFDLKPHYHSDYESRLFLEGSAVFTIDGEDIVCSKGTYIEILPEVVHAFEYKGDGPLHVLRFFSENEFWKATFV